MSSKSQINPPIRANTVAMYEPVQDVFKTQHSTDHNRAIAQDGLILLTEVGSTMHGVSQDASNDDIDEMGICIEPPQEVIGLGTFEQYEYRTQPVNARSGAGDIDRTIYSLSKWARLAAAGNPTVLMPLFTNADPDVGHMRYLNMFGQSLRAVGPRLFITKQAGHKFLGYLDGQRSRYLDITRQDSKHASRPELIEKYGWDTKTGYHALRLAIQGIELMETGRIDLPMGKIARTFLLKVRNGEYSKEHVTGQLDEYWIPNLKKAITESKLPDKPDYTAINSWLTSMYIDSWRERNYL